MWCIVGCSNHTESKILKLCKQLSDPWVLREAFIFTYDSMKRYQGQWHIETRRMYPDYLFVETGNRKALLEHLESYCGFAHGMGDQAFLLQADQEEEAFLRRLCGDRHHLGMSKGVIRQGIPYVTEGPLRGLENRICKIDRHKRTARIQVPLRHTPGSIVAGLEIISKS